MKRKFTSIAAVILPLLLAACGPSAGSIPTVTPTGSAADGAAGGAAAGTPTSATGGTGASGGAAGGTEITVGYSGGASIEPYFKQVFDQAAKDLPGIRIRPVVYAT